MDGQTAAGKTVLSDVSAVIPLYNKESTIVRAVRSILDGSVLPLEIIVVDDGSTDGSVKALEAADSPLLRVVSRPNGGAAAARNTGIGEVKGQYVAFLDADDVWLPNFLKTALTLKEDFPDAGLYGLSYAVDRGNGPFPFAVKGIPPHPWRGRIRNLLEILQSGVPFCSDTVLIPKAVFDKLGGFMEGEAIGEDVQMWANISLHYPIVFDTVPGAVYRQDAPNRAYVEDKPLHAAGYAAWLDSVIKTFPDETLRRSAEALREHVELGRLRSLAGAGQRKKAREVYRAYPFDTLRGPAKKWAWMARLPRPLYLALRRIKKSSGH